MSFYYLDQNINSVNPPFENFGFNNEKFNFENFESMPPIDKQNSDNLFQCSDNVQITGNAFGSSIPNTTLNNCKSECKTQGSCIGFDFDNTSSSCTLKNTITDLTSTKQNNVMCVKKTASACKVNPQVDPATEAENVISENTEQENKPSPMGPMSPLYPPGVVIPLNTPSPMPGPPSNTNNQNPVNPNSQNPLNPYNPDPSNPYGPNSVNPYRPNSVNPYEPNSVNPYGPTPSPTTKPIPKPVAPTQTSKCKADTIFVDLPCFLNKMDILKNHSDNLMIDLQLLITNLKSCSYVKKINRKKPSSGSNPFKPINGNGTSSESDDDFNFNFGDNQSSESSSATISNSNVPVVMPTQDTIKVYNTQASVLYTNNPTNNANIMLGITEPFESVEQNESSFFATFTFKFIVLLLVLILIMKI